MVALWHGAGVSETGQTDRVTAVPEKLDQWHDFRKSVALVSMVLFFFCVVGLGFLVYQLAIAGDDGTFSTWSFFRFASVAIPLGVAAVAGLGVYRASSSAESKRRGRVMALALLAAAILLVVTGIIGDRLS
ncbi:hypothetical protein FHX75_111354 [Micromonospora palomenae]|uniref:Uncharacterized protein n=1 Tax=Micromonospora palomenae TaxID=1461247 RepID=A0A561WWH1_9ACTN|nr:hypothetical protein [Micromonospora palomenae]TWG28203.1 hypothetical protein FHX75_111354 [Micromonospora palomenae]